MSVNRPVLSRPVVPWLLAAFLLAGCSADVRVSTEFDRSADFSALVRYRWTASPAGFGGAVPMAGYRGAGLEQRLREGVDRRMREKGFLPDTAGADFTVTYLAPTEERTRTLDGGYSLAMGPATEAYEVGALVLEIANARSGILIWRGTAAGALPGGSDPEPDADHLDRILDDLLGGFPPR